MTELYRHFDPSGRLLYVGIAMSALSRLIGHRDRAVWFDSISTITVERFETLALARAAELAAIRNEKPLFNVLGVLPSKRHRDPGRIEDAIVAAGGITALARKVGIKPQGVVQWRARGVPALRVLKVEAATGGRVTRHDLRPDLYPEEAATA